VRLIRHLNEQKRTPYHDEADKIAEILLKSCLPAIKEMRVAKKVLWRGMYGTSSGINLHQTRKDREPKDAGKFVHKLMDEIFGRKYGWFPRSNSAICSNSYGIASDYGFPRTVFPIGRYKCLWARGVADTLDVYDAWMQEVENRPKSAISMYMHSKDRKLYGDIDVISAPVEDQIEQLEKIARKAMEVALSRFQQTGLKEPLKHPMPIEIMVGCKEYYSVESKIMNRVVPLLKIEADNL